MGKSHTVDDYRDGSGNWRKYLSIEGIQHSTISGSRWAGMRHRCKVGGSKQRVSPSYKGCTIDDNFKDFQIFTEWHRKQVGYGFSGYQLDKDILIQGNKIYSATTCALIPQALNKFGTSSKDSRGNFKQGVYWDTPNFKFKAQINTFNKRTCLGRFKTEGEAYAAYKSAKEAEGYRWYERLKAGEFIVDERVIERMRTWTLEE